jgi:hypothetical protein
MIQGAPATMPPEDVAVKFKTRLNRNTVKTSCGGRRVPTFGSADIFRTQVTTALSPVTMIS